MCQVVWSSFMDWGYCASNLLKPKVIRRWSFGQRPQHFRHTPPLHPPGLEQLNWLTCFWKCNPPPDWPPGLPQAVPNLLCALGVSRTGSHGLPCHLRATGYLGEAGSSRIICGSKNVVWVVHKVFLNYSCFIRCSCTYWRRYRRVFRL